MLFKQLQRIFKGDCQSYAHEVIAKLKAGY